MDTIESDINRPLYFEPSEAVAYGLIDKVCLEVCPHYTPSTIFLTHFQVLVD